jgi:hypothetical protein
VPEGISKIIAQARRHPAASGAALGCIAIAAFCLNYIFKHSPPWELDHLWQRHADLKPAHLDDYIAFGLWIGAAIGAAVSTILAVTSFLWARPPTSNTVEIGGGDGFPARRFWLILGVIVIVAGAIRAPRLDHPLWGDEAWAYSDLIGGKYTQHEDGSLGFKRHPWKLTTFKDKGGNNQYLFTLAARHCNDLWQKATGAPTHAFNEAALRIPALVAGLLSLVAAALLLRRLGFSAAGLALAVLLCINPWHIRYSTEARGYTMLVLFLILALYFVTRALASDRRRWWICFALAEFAALYTWKAAMHPLAAVNLAVILIIVLRLKKSSLIPLSRCAAANALAGAPFLALFAPAILQLELLFKRSISFDGEMGFTFFRSTWSQLLGAMDWSGGDKTSPFDTLTVLAANIPLAIWGFALVAVPAIALYGFASAVRVRREATLLLVAPAFGALLAFVHFSLKGIALHKWYLFYTLPVLLALLALGLTQMRHLAPRLRPLPLVAFASVYLAIFGPHLATLLTTPIHDTRGADAITRNDEEPPLSLAASNRTTLAMFRRVTAYDPRMMQRHGQNKEHLRSGKSLKAALRDADAAGRSVRLSICNIPYGRATHPTFFELVDDPFYCTKLKAFPGLEPYIAIDVYEYISGSIPVEEERSN